MESAARQDLTPPQPPHPTLVNLAQVSSLGPEQVLVHHGSVLQFLLPSLDSGGASVANQPDRQTGPELGRFS